MHPLNMGHDKSAGPSSDGPLASRFLPVPLYSIINLPTFPACTASSANVSPGNVLRGANPLTTSTPSLVAIVVH